MEIIIITGIIIGYFYIMPEDFTIIKDTISKYYHIFARKIRRL